MRYQIQLVLNDPSTCKDIEAFQSWTVSKLKEMISAKLNRPLNSFNITFNEVTLESDKLVSDYDLADDNAIDIYFNQSIS